MTRWSVQVKAPTLHCMPMHARNIPKQARMHGHVGIHAQEGALQRQANMPHQVRHGLSSNVHVCAGDEEHSIAAHQAPSRPAAPCPGLCEADAGAAEGVPGDALAAALQEQEHNQPQSSDGHEQQHPEDGNQQEAAAACKEKAAGSDDAEHVGAQADCMMPDAEQTRQTPHVSGAGTAAGSSPSRCTHLTSPPGSGPSGMPLASAAAAEASPAGTEMPFSPAVQAGEQHDGIDLQARGGQHESAEHTVLQGAHTTFHDDDDAEGNVLDTDQLDTLQFQRLSIEQIVTPPVDARGDRDKAADRRQQLAMSEQQSTVQRAPGTAEMPDKASVGQLAAPSACGGTLPQACIDSMGNGQTRDQHHVQQHHEEQDMDPQHGLPNTPSTPHAATGTPPSAADAHASPTACVSQPAGAASDSVPAALQAGLQGTQTSAAAGKDSAGSFSFPKPLEPEALYEPRRPRSPQHSRLPAQITALAPGTGISASAHAAVLNKRPPGALPQPAMKRRCLPVHQPHLLQSGRSPAARAEPAAWTGSSGTSPASLT